MDTAHSQHLSRISRMLLAGIGVAFAWVLLSILLNLSVPQAHAADGLLGDTVETVAPVTEPVTEVAAPVTEPVAEAAAPVTQPVAEAAAPVTEPVAQTAAPVTQPVAETAAPVAEPVAQAAAPVAQTAAPVVEPVAKTVAPVGEAAAPVAQPVAKTVAPVAKTVAPATQPVSKTVAPVTSTVAPVTQTVGQTVAPVAKTVAPVVATVGQTVAPISDPVLATVAPVVGTVADSASSFPVAPVVTSVVDTVGGTPQNGVVTPILNPTLGVVETVPVVGGVVTDLGLDTAASGAGSSVDGVLQGGATVVVRTASGAIDKSGRIVTVAPVSPLTGVPAVGAALHGAPAATTASALRAAAGSPWETLARAAFLSGAAAWHALTSDLSAALTSPDTAFVSSWAATGIFALLRSVAQADSSLVGPGGAGPGAWVLVALGLVVAYRAWVRRTGLENDVAPAAPVLSTDVSPD